MLIKKVIKARVHVIESVKSDGTMKWINSHPIHFLLFHGTIA